MRIAKIFALVFGFGLIVNAIRNGHLAAPMDLAGGALFALAAAMVIDWYWRARDARTRRVIERARLKEKAK
jgi:uncharacterized membrane protein